MSATNERLQAVLGTLPGLDCGVCGAASCKAFAQVVLDHPDELKKCVHTKTRDVKPSPQATANCGRGCTACDPGDVVEQITWQDSLGRDFDFILDTFPNEPGPRETILPHNPMLTREMDMKPGDIMIGRPLGMSCGCPITHCGVVTDVDPRTGVMVWCVTGPLQPRSKPHKDIGYYAAEAYEGIVRNTRAELKIGMRYWFQPRRCMLQWRHSGLINFMRKTRDGVEIRIEGLLIG
jgi:uncharacterized Fe-S cluster-containing protein